MSVDVISCCHLLVLLHIKCNSLALRFSSNSSRHLLSCIFASSTVFCFLGLLCNSLLASQDADYFER